MLASLSLASGFWSRLTRPGHPGQRPLSLSVDRTILRPQFFAATSLHLISHSHLAHIPKSKSLCMDVDSPINVIGETPSGSEYDGVDNQMDEADTTVRMDNGDVNAEEESQDLERETPGHEGEGHVKSEVDHGMSERRPIAAEVQEHEGEVGSLAMVPGAAAIELEPDLEAEEQKTSTAGTPVQDMASPAGHAERDVGVLGKHCAALCCAVIRPLWAVGSRLITETRRHR